MLSKQSIRKEHTIFLNKVEMSKEEILVISQDFTDTEEQRFRKMLKQGGTFFMQGKEFEIRREENKFRNSKGDYEEAAKPHRAKDWE